MIKMREHVKDTISRSYKEVTKEAAPKSPPKSLIFLSVNALNMGPKSQ